MDKITKRGIHRRLPIVLTDNLTRRFWKSVEVLAEDKCWEWQASCRNGYGAIKHRNKVISCHRLSYVIHFGEPLDGHVVRHTCDNRICCNPGHLISGTPGDNVADAVERGRHRVPKGEDVYSSLFADEFIKAVWEIRRLTGWGHRKVEAVCGLKRDALKTVFCRGSYRHCVPAWAQGDLRKIMNKVREDRRIIMSYEASEMKVTPIDDIVQMVELRKYEASTDRGDKPESEYVFTGEMCQRIDPVLEGDELSMIREHGRALLETEHEDVFIEVTPMHFAMDGTLVVECEVNW